MLRVAALLVAVVVLVVACVTVGVVRSPEGAPASDPVSARVAEWMRGHRLGLVVTGLEQAVYWVHPPRAGGAPAPGLLPLPDPGPSGDARAAASGAAPTPPDDGLHAPLAPLVGPALPGEGVFRAEVPTASGPAVQVAYLRPDSVHTSYLTAVMVMSAGRLRLVQHPGYQDPGNLSWWSQPDLLDAGARTGLAATFNGGFKLADAQGGYYADGHVVGALRPGAASLVIDEDGRATIGSWGEEVSMSPRVASVRQNLGLLIDHGQIAASTDASTRSTWGATLGGGDFVWRSGLGVDAHGDLVYVVGDALSANTLAQVLHRAGAVRAMQLDINPEWVSGMWYSPTSAPETAHAHKLLDFARPADRYATASSRDFIAAYTR